jgi:hypothetical protein
MKLKCKKYDTQVDCWHLRHQQRNKIKKNGALGSVVGWGTVLQAVKVAGSNPD